jgi:YfiH family protein
VSAPAPALELSFELPGGARAAFTAKAHGNLSSVGGEQAELGEAARERLREQLGLRRLLRGHQVHGTRVRLITEIPASPRPRAAGDAADGQATALRRVGTLVMCADCLPVALACEGAVAMVHAGWRGLAAGVLDEGVRALAQLGGRPPIVAVVGPCAGPCCYEVGAEVHDALGGRHRRGTHVDLRAIAHEQLLAAGVAEVLDAAACTICDERLFSHRRERARAGRQGGVAWLI